MGYGPAASSAKHVSSGAISHPKAFKKEGIMRIRRRRRRLRIKINKDSRFFRMFPILVHFNAANMVTTMGLVFGIFACYFLTQQNLQFAIICLFLAGVMDLIDGFVATKLNQESKFGKHIDSLVDFFICIIIPVWMVFDLLPHGIHTVGPLIFYCICGLWRLANYNIAEPSSSFTGVPVPTGVLIVVVAIWCVVMYNFHIALASFAFVSAGLLMISGIKLPKYGAWQFIVGFSGLGFVIVVIFHYEIARLVGLN